MRVLLMLARVAPWLVRLPVGRQLRRARTDPEVAIEKRTSGAADPEVAMHHSEAGRILNASTAEAGRQGPTSAAREGALIAGRWGFDLVAIDVPVGVWHGTLDRTIPVGVARFLADAIPDSRLTVHDDVGHLSLPVTYDEGILAFLVDPIDESSG